MGKSKKLLKVYENNRRRKNEVWKTQKRKKRVKITQTQHNNCLPVSVAGFFLSFFFNYSNRRCRWGLGGSRGLRRRQHCWAAYCSLWFLFIYFSPIFFLALVKDTTHKKKKRERGSKFYCYTRKITTNQNRTERGSKGCVGRLQGVAFWLRFRFRRRRSQKSKIPKSKSRNIEDDYW